MISMEAEGLQENPSIEALLDFSRGKVIPRDTSYLGEQNEVNEMVNATKDKKWPGFWYEILQGSFDFNDWSKGPPQMRIFYEGQKNPITLDQYLKDRRSGNILTQVLNRHKVARIECANHIRGETGLRPSNVVLTQHQEKDDATPLGVHGRGLKIATTATYSGKLAKDISFTSWVPEIGAWHAKAGMVQDPIDPKSPEYFQLRYKQDKNLTLNETVVTVEEPSEALLDALEELPNWFLPANPNYRFGRLIASQGKIANRLTVFCNERNSSQTNDVAFTPRELLGWGHRNIENRQSLEPPRVEILSPELFSSLPGEIDFVYVDGLKVYVEGAEFTQIYAFWGLGKGSPGYNPGRSNDSLKLTGTYRDLLGETLARCTNDQVFASIFHANSTEKLTQEANVWFYDFDHISRYPQALEALKAGYSAYKKAVNAPDDASITSSVEAFKRAKRENKPVIFINSSAIVEVMVKNVPNIIQVETIFEQEAEAERQARAEEQRKHVEEIAKLLKERHDLEEEHRRKIEAAILQDRKDRGVRSEAVKTGEIMKVEAPENNEDSKRMAELHLLNAMASNEGRLLPREKPGELIIEMKADTFTQLPRNTIQLKSLGGFVQEFLAVFGELSDVEIRIIKQNNGVFFKFSQNSSPDPFGNITIGVAQGILDVQADSLIRITLADVPERDAYQTEQHLREEYTAYLSQLTKDIQSLSNESYVINPETYEASDFYKEYPPSLDLIRVKRALDEQKQSTQQQLAAINLVREKAGLPPIPDPFSSAKPLSPPSSNVNIHDYEPNFPPEGRGIFIDKHIIGDVPTIAQTLRLIHPDSVPGISRWGYDERLEYVVGEESPRERFIDALHRRLKEVLKREITPDFTLISGEMSKVRGYLISHINPATSETSTRDYQIFPGLSYEKKPGMATLRFNKAIKTGLNTLLCPPGYRPVAYHHELGSMDITISGNTEKNVYAFTLHEDAKPGLTFYFERINHIESTLPDSKEKAMVADFDSLKPHWHELIFGLRNSSLTDKEKCDVLLRAWTKAFNYDDSQATFDLYQDVRNIDSALYTAIVNNAAGNCGYAEMGFHALLSLAGIPSREVACFLSDGYGNYSMHNCYHGVNQAYLDGRWVLIEPQQTYLEAGYDLQEIPKNYRDKFNLLLSKIPIKHLYSPRQLMELPPILPDTLPPLRDISDEIKEAILALIPITLPSIPKEMIKTVTIYGTVTFIASKIITYLAQKTAVYAQNLSTSDGMVPIQTPLSNTPTPSSVPQIFGRPLPDILPQLPHIDLSNLIPKIPILEPSSAVISPEVVRATQEVVKRIPLDYMVPALLFGLTAGVGVGYYLRDKQNERNHGRVIAEENIGMQHPDIDLPVFNSPD
jgi:hypothetical protein